MKTENNCSVLGTGDKTSDHSYVSKRTPIDIKKSEFLDTEKYYTDLNAGFDRVRETTTRIARDKGKARPLGGK